MDLGVTNSHRAKMVEWKVSSVIDAFENLPDSAGPSIRLDCFAQESLDLRR